MTAVPDLTGKSALVTGASDGVGKEIARALAAAGAAVIMPVRDSEKGARAAESIRATVPTARLTLADLDLARMESVDALAASLNAQGASLDLYVMNAGAVMLGDRRRHVTPDGMELHLQTNFLGHFALTLGILPLLRQHRARIAVQVSIAAARARIDWSDLQLERRYRALRAYRQSKLALGLFGVELARRNAAGGWGITSTLCHPGIAPGSSMAPGIRTLVPAPIARWAAEHLGNPLPDSALPALMALTTESAAPVIWEPSRWFGMAGPPRRRPLPRWFADPGAATRVWEAAERLCAAARRH